jgi:chorismate dehydratase
MMANGLLDAALLPSIEYFRAGDYRIIPGISICAEGTVESVCIFSKTPLDRIRVLALDESSRTSAALTRILLKRKLGALPELTCCSPDDDLDDIEADAMLLIGDSAMAFDQNSAEVTLDLGREWKELTGLPFVYAMWVARRDVDTRSFRPRLLAARERGVLHLREISNEAAADTGLDAAQCLNYIENVMRYDLGEREIAALERFQQLAAEDGLCPGGVDIVFTD